MENDPPELQQNLMVLDCVKYLGKASKTPNSWVNLLVNDATQFLVISHAHAVQVLLIT